MRTCKANKFNVLLSSDVQKNLQVEDVIALLGDWTHPSDTINQFLQKRGLVAVTFNQIYGPGLPQGKILSPLLNKRLITNFATSQRKCKMKKLILTLLLASTPLLANNTLFSVQQKAYIQELNVG